MLSNPIGVASWDFSVTRLRGESSTSAFAANPASQRWVPDALDTPVDTEEGESSRSRRPDAGKGANRRSRVFASSVAPVTTAPPRPPRRRVRSKGRVVEIKVERDVFIPSAVTVENLARVLNVKRGTDRISRI